MQRHLKPAIRSSTSAADVEGCVASNYPRTIYAKDEWAIFQTAYNKLRPHDAGTPGTDGFLVDYEVQDNPIRGRTIVTKEDLPPGKQFWSGDLWHVSFGQEEEFLQFLGLLPSLAYRCEILLWAYVTHGKVSVELDAGSFFNHHDDEKVRNVSPTTAKKYVKAGSELLMDYSSFIEYNTLPWFDRLRSNAWKEPESDGDTAGAVTTVYQSTNGYNLLGAPEPKHASGTIPTTSGTEATIQLSQPEGSSVYSNPLLAGFTGMIIAGIIMSLSYWKFLKKASYKIG